MMSDQPSEAMMAALRSGTPLVLPTDTVYGLVALASNHAAVEAIFAVKDRPVDTQIAALVSGVDQARQLVAFGEAGERLAAAFWPGALTIVAARRDGVNLAVGDSHTVGVRCPDHRLVRQLAAELGPLAATSANRHGQLTPVTAAAVRESLPEIELVVDGGTLSGGASTVVSVVDEQFTVLRQGPVTEQQIAAALDLSI